ncbi:hypothetical protein N7475_009437 [Penicillium sp. IBT 31633x]|nr:hypothetical protein N7475_009437 [Penicillium sp. IBT 31633x]
MVDYEEAIKDSSAQIAYQSQNNLHGGCFTQLEKRASYTIPTQSNYRGVAAYCSHKEAQLLLEYGADPNLCTEDKTSTLHAAALMGHPNIVAQLIKWGANINSVGPRGLTPLHVVARQIITGVKARYKRTVDVILQAPGIDVNACDEDDRTPLSISAELGGDVPAYFVQKVLEQFDIDISTLKTYLGKQHFTMRLNKETLRKSSSYYRTAM